MTTPTRQLAAIMFADMVGYSALMQQNEELAVEKKEKFKRCFEESISRHGGRIIQYYGDGVLTMFNSALRAVHGAIEIQKSYIQKPRIDARIGIHVGEIMVDDVGAYGDGVNIASRVESIAVPGSIFISEKVFDEIKNHQEVSTKALGYFELKNVAKPMQLYAISNSDVVVPSRDEVKGKVKQSLDSIAVLPFVSMSADPENEYFCDGLSEELINVLAKIEELQVTARSSAFAFKGRNEDVREIGARLNVQKVIEGSVRKAGNKVRITVQLINAADGYHLWSESYDRDLQDIFQVQDDISRTIANKLRKNLAANDHNNKLVKPSTENLDAYNVYLRGLHFWNKQTTADIMIALELFHEAVALEPGFANPYFYIVYITAFLPHVGALGLEEARRICNQAAAKAMEIDPMNAWSQLASGITALYFDWDMGKTEQCLLKAVELNPNLTETHSTLGWYYLFTRQMDKIDEPLKKAAKLDPVGGESIPSAAEVCFHAWKLDEAENFCNEALKANPDNMYANGIKALVIGFKGDPASAIEIFERLHKENPDFLLITCLLGYFHAKDGNKERAREFLSQFIEKSKQPDSAPLSMLIALMHLALGEKENFYLYYEEAMNSKLVTCLYFYNSPLLSDVNGEERIISLRRKHNLPE